MHHDDPLQRLVDGIAAHAGMWASAYKAQRADWRHPSFAVLLLTHGRSFAPGPRPAHVEPGPPGMCFATALAHAEQHGLIYVEGMALTPHEPLGFDHAWCIAEADGRVVDPTLPDGYVLAYVGVPLTPEYRRAQQAMRGCDAILTSGRTTWTDNATALREGLPVDAMPVAGRPIPAPRLLGA
ncbi:UNVERIFIED_ORG: hypothetical protein FHR35_009123 [Microbispora rosea subsp. rosea]